LGTCSTHFLPQGHSCSAPMALIKSLSRRKTWIESLKKLTIFKCKNPKICNVYSGIDQFSLITLS
jgi:hypothetical protein